MSTIKLWSIIKIIAGIILWLLFIYNKTQPYKNLLSPKHLTYFNYLDFFFSKCLSPIKSIRPIKIGASLSFDSAQLILLTVLILLLIN